ncbi:uncharacterized protein EKO05_0010447 [Ascochyta rabiei]|uniref:Uncharacterized protein n=1 Tax=Didymella rabiei TaxID=5454 RepID=A0A163GI58_DIDRA|nr:uncharacterized protein EKO05_0010447 [Ascochyta rabiei]KZM24866.1 hypothetical protein ST47_g3994 [Ascochyta rabiei]UPX20207.1 hypothetical protein EKO05_0010447 [Ascochyta rabiei]
MPATIITFAMAQAACTAVSGGINSYLKAPARASFAEPSGQETLWDEDNWARIMDLKDVLCLVRPFIIASQNLDLDTIERATTSSIKGSGRRLGTPGPPAYSSSDMPADPEAWLSQQAYCIGQATMHFVEMLNVTAAGPSGSSPRAWNLNVTAAEEVGLEVLSLYCETTQTMSDAPSGTFLAVARSEMRFHDAQLLKVAQSHFKAVEFGHTYLLRLPSERRCLAISENLVAQSKVVKRTMKGAGIVASAIAGPIGMAFVGGSIAARHYWKNSKAASAARKPVARAGEPGTRLSFVPASRFEKENCNNELRYGMLINIVEQGGDSSNGLRVSADGVQLAEIRIVHCEERHRNQSQGRAICIRDRVLLKEEGTGRLLGRKKVAEETWEVGFGISDDNAWVVSPPV